MIKESLSVLVILSTIIGLVLSFILQSWILMSLSAPSWIWIILFLSVASTLVLFIGSVITSVLNELEK